MHSVYELRTLLRDLVENWPGEHNHPTVEQAREHLGQTAIYKFFDGDLSEDQNQDYYDALWYSL